VSNNRKASEISEDLFAAIFIVLLRVSFGISEIVKIKQSRFEALNLNR